MDAGMQDEEEEEMASPQRKGEHLQDHGQSPESQININEARGVEEEQQASREEEEEESNKTQDNDQDQFKLA